VWDVEVVQERREIGMRGKIQQGLRSGRDRFSTLGVRREGSDNRRVEKDFHFSAEPTVTAGFIGFVFDIR
jgi:hypothetical protein